MMKSISQLFLLLAALFTLNACSDTKVQGEGKESAASEEGHEHSYRCPMNCEKGKTYDKPGECPVCGMDLEHYDGGEDNGLTYKMQYSSNPSQLDAGEAAT